MTTSHERASALSAAESNVSLMAKDQYFRQLAWTEPLTDEEQDTLLHCVLHGNAERLQVFPHQSVLSLARDARDRLIEVYQPLVVAVARRRLFLFESMELLDVIQEGNVGLVEALAKYSEKEYREYPFRTFVISRVKYALSHALSQRDAFLRLPQHKHALLIRKSMVESQLGKLLGRQPSSAEVAEALDVTEEVLKDVIEADKHRQVDSLQHMIGTEEVPEDKADFVSLYASSVVSEDARQEELAATFQRVFAAAMPEKQRAILELRYGIGEGPGVLRPVELVAEMLGAGYDTTTTLEQKAKKRLERLLEPVVMADGRLSCTFHDLYSEEYCTTGEAAALLGMSATTVKEYALAGFLPYEMRSRVPNGGKERVFKKADVQDLQQQRAAAPEKRFSRRPENASLVQARRSASLPSIVA